MKKVTKEKTTGIILHILVWTVFLGLTTLSARRFKMGNNFLLTYYAFMAINALIFYTNYLFLVPQLFLRKRRNMYLVAVLALVLCLYFVSDFTNGHIYNFISRNEPDQIERLQDRIRARPGPPIRPRFFIALPNAHLIGYSASSVFMVILSLGIRVLERQSEIEKTQDEAEKAKLNAELAFLKNQVSPHFFFNTLNNIYSLIGINAEDSQKAVLKLSKLMRYLLYESEQGDVRLSDEIDFMNNYIDLMKLRMSEKVDLNISFPDKYEDVIIPPLLFIPFIENAFKHGITYRAKSFINVKLVSSGKSLEFSCLNSMVNKEKIDVNSGIGLENVRKRLNLLFPYSHELLINNDHGKFDVFVRINLA